MAGEGACFSYNGQGPLKNIFPSTGFYPSKNHSPPPVPHRSSEGIWDCDPYRVLTPALPPPLGALPQPHPTQASPPDIRGGGWLPLVKGGKYPLYRDGAEGGGHMQPPFFSCLPAPTQQITPWEIQAFQTSVFDQAQVAPASPLRALLLKRGREVLEFVGGRDLGHLPDPYERLSTQPFYGDRKNLQEEVGGTPDPPPLAIGGGGSVRFIPPSLAPWPPSFGGVVFRNTARGGRSTPTTPPLLTFVLVNPLPTPIPRTPTSRPARDPSPSGPDAPPGGPTVTPSDPRPPSDPTGPLIPSLAELTTTAPL